MVPEGWHIGRLDELVGALNAGVSVNSEDSPALDGEKAVLKTSCVSSGVYDSSCNKRVVDTGEIVRLKEPVHSDRIIVSRMNTPILVGANAYVQKGDPNIFLPDRLWQLSPRSEAVNMRWLAYYLASPHGRFSLSTRATGTSGSMKNITKDDVRSLKIPIPPDHERDVIASILMSWDASIALVEKLVSNSVRQKKVLMHQLLTGKRRLPWFEEEWREEKISGISKRIQRKAGDGDYPVMMISSKVGFLRQNQKYSRYMAGRSVDNYILLKKGEFAYNKGNSKTYEFGCVFPLEEYAEGLVPHVYVCIKLADECDHNYYKYLFEFDYLKRQLGRVVNTGVRNNGLLNIRPEEFLNAKVPVPPIAEQRAIAAVIRTADAEIENFERRLQALNQQKRALMQQLLTGKRRVKVDKEAA